ncbi:YceI family protein [Ulvibacter litoralis]|uniref:Polyisoprenoid-binding protein YceI n=1 Tax=Ulvibacter litoralis TaxID=227084 RepID=A0A1G7J0Q3_9FLAO|nr:YceI family protein [Ulvibacter litoralis]GHC60428.1 hypothetical protein GCM10008083_26670 [Ulvibacter litoralis]SDF18455.1 Polyisoprenoid-binding protein YceI [Ulvibacter litoralis]
MKTTIKTLLVLAVVFGTAAFTTSTIERKEVKEGTITWKGKKILGSHTGTIDLKSGYLEMDGDALTGGEFIVDMTTIVCTDLEGDTKGKLEGHLKSDDFFGVENHPIATLTIKKATKSGNTYAVTGDLMIKGVTESIDFDLEMGDSGASTSVKVDRTKYGIKYGSGDFFDSLGDNAISNKFELDVVLKF